MRSTVIQNGCEVLLLNWLILESTLKVRVQLLFDWNFWATAPQRSSIQYINHLVHQVLDHSTVAWSSRVEFSLVTTTHSTWYHTCAQGGSTSVQLSIHLECQSIKVVVCAPVRSTTNEGGVRLILLSDNATNSYFLNGYCHSHHQRKTSALSQLLNVSFCCLGMPSSLPPNHPYSVDWWLDCCMAHIINVSSLIFTPNRPIGCHATQFSTLIVSRSRVIGTCIDVGCVVYARHVDKWQPRGIHTFTPHSSRARKY